MAVLFLETVQNGPNDRRERVPIPPRIRRKGRPQKLEEPFPDDLLQQHILIRIVNVERSPVDVGAVGNILDADGRKPFLPHDRDDSFLEHLAGPPDSSVPAFPVGIHGAAPFRNKTQQFRSSVQYSTRGMIWR